MNGFVGLQKILLRLQCSDKLTVKSLMQCVLAKVEPHEEQYLAGCDLLIPKRSQRRYRSATPTGDVTTKGAGRPPVGAIETSATVEFFFGHTFVRSGAKNNTRRMAMRKDEMYATYRASFPAILSRAEVIAASGIFESEGLSQFLKQNLEKKLEDDDLEMRHDFFMSRVEYFRTDRVSVGSQSLNKIGTVDDPHGLTARSFNTFWDILKRAKVRYLRSEPI
jgi:hypothetical protein